MIIDPFLLWYYIIATVFCLISTIVELNSEIKYNHHNIFIIFFIILFIGWLYFPFIAYLHIEDFYGRIFKK